MSVMNQQPIECVSYHIEQQSKMKLIQFDTNLKSKILNPKCEK
jgi:hypothetical protein